MDKDTLLRWYRQMVLIRTFEQKCSELYQQGKIGGFLHLYIGQEAVAVGSINARQTGDHLITAYRDHAHAIMAGTEVKYLMAEMLGKATGVSKGKGGSMHLADVSKHYWGGYGIVGGHVPLGVGIALAEQYKGTDNAVLCYMGDGSTNIGYFHESLNLASVWDLPVLFIVENNQYGMGTAVERASAVKTMVEKATAYGMEGVQVDGMNALAVYEATEKALQLIRQGKGPQFLEMITYRFEGHSMGDPLRYRTKEELHKWQENDPIGILEKYLLDVIGATQEEMDALDEEVKLEIDSAVKFAEESPFPALETLFDDIYVNP
ncbi:MAG: pyruvate dehydrogenase (acetyl-transferring) E1 component subunit alpha [Chloroflexi bacterium]|nr:pyruvate dehydrogenase (acetyl-transferring) E1 component subunit alpha [Chloroflexota bacterium]MBP8054508.1 pyruvate dehydrogenase (acetyl-transferring) E1 component subunit alpha [Chloroflexota bacterium]